MLAYVGRRLILAVPTVIGAATISFLLMRVIPGDPAQVLAGPDAQRADIDRLRQQLGLDESIIEQYFQFMGGLFTGDLGISARTRDSVLSEILARLPYTLELAALSLSVAVLVGTTLGVTAAINRNGKMDTFASTLSVFGVSMPTYWSGLLFIIFFSVHLGWFPVGGAETWQHRILPTATLSFFLVGYIARQARSAMVETLEMDFIRSVRAKGVSSWRVIIGHGLRNASLPIITIIGLQFGTLVGGAVLTETIFAWPGLGRLIVQSISTRDFPVVQASIFLFAVALIVINLVTDIIYAYVDPRIRYDR